MTLVYDDLTIFPHYLIFHYKNKLLSEVIAIVLKREESVIPTKEGIQFFQYVVKNL